MVRVPLLLLLLLLWLLLIMVMLVLRGARIGPLLVLRLRPRTRIVMVLGLGPVVSELLLRLLLQRPLDKPKA
jgi:hypothetical protein